MILLSLSLLVHILIVSFFYDWLLFKSAEWMPCWQLAERILGHLFHWWSWGGLFSGTLGQRFKPGLPEWQSGLMTITPFCNTSPLLSRHWLFLLCFLPWSDICASFHMILLSRPVLVSFPLPPSSRSEALNASLFRNFEVMKKGLGSLAKYKFA